MTRAQDKRIPKTRIRASRLRAALKDVNGIVEARNTIPILASVLFQVRDQRIRVMATDLDQWAIRECASDDRDGPDSRDWLAAIKPFTVCLPAATMAAVLAELDGDAMVTIEAPIDVNDQWSGQVTLSAGRARFRLHALPVSDFPLLDTLAVESSFEIGCSQLADILSGVDHAISNDETRYYLNGIYMHPADLDLRFAATDGHRLARWSIDGPIGAASFPGVIVGRKTVAVLEKLLASAVKADDETGGPPAVLIEANEGGSRLRFVISSESGDEVEIIAKMVDGTFPDYSRVIPSDPKLRLIIGRADLAATVKRIAVMAASKSRAVKLSLDTDRLTISAQSPELGEASEELACTYAGPQIAFGFDSKYLRDALLKIGSDEVALRFGDDPASPVRMAGWEDDAEAGALLQVVMPVRV